MNDKLRQEGGYTDGRTKVTKNKGKGIYVQQDVNLQ